MAVGATLAKDGLTDDEILRSFKAAAQRLYAIIQAADPSSPFQVYCTKHLREILSVILQLDGKARDWAEQHIPAIMEAAHAETIEAVKGFEEKDFAVQFSGVDREAVKALTEATTLDFGNTVGRLKRSGEKMLIDKRMLRRKIVEGVIQGSSVYRTQTELMDALRKDGFSVLVGRGNRKIRIEPYTNTLVRSQSVFAFNTARARTLLGSGRRYAIFPTLRPDIDGDDICNTWELKKYLDLTVDPLPPISTHPNCRHVIQAVSFEQLKRERPDLYPSALAFFRQVAGS